MEDTTKPTTETNNDNNNNNNNEIRNLEPISVTLHDLPDALDIATYTAETNCLIIDNKDSQASRFLRYQRGAYLQAARKEDVEPESVRKALVGSMEHGGWFTMSFGEFDTDLRDVFQFENKFDLLNRKKLFQEETFTTLLKPDLGDPAPNLFIPKDDFKLIFVTNKDPPQVGLDYAVKNFQIIKMKNEEANQNKSEADKKFEADAALASMFGVKLVKRNSLEMVEAAFDGEIDVVKEWIEKGYDIESVDGHDNTSLGEAAAQNQDEIVKYLLELGADPNAQNDQGRSPLFRASFNGHKSTILLLLNSGGDPDLKAKGAEAPFHVAKTEEIRTILDNWDRQQVEILKQERDAIIRQKMEERLATAAEKEALARELIRKSLVDHAKNGNVDELKGEIERLVMEAEREGSRNCRGSVKSRDERGQTLLMIAAQAGKTEMVNFLLSHYKTIEDDPFSDGPSLEQRSFRPNVNARDSKGWTPVSVAAFHGHKDSLRLILESGGDPMIPNNYGKNAFQVVEPKKDLLGAMLYKGNEEMLDVLETWKAEKKAKELGFDNIDAYKKAEIEKQEAKGATAKAEAVKAKKSGGKSNKSSSGKKGGKKKGNAKKGNAKKSSSSSSNSKAPAAGSGANAVKALSPKKKKG